MRTHLLLLSLLAFSCVTFTSIVGQEAPIDLPDVQQRTTFELTDFTGLYRPDVWHRILMKCILLSPGFLPAPAISRAHGMIAQAHFDSIAFYNDTLTLSMDYTQYLSTFVSVKRPRSEWTIANCDTAISYAAYTVLQDIFATKQPALDYLTQMMSNFGYAATSTQDVSLPAGVGNQIGVALVNAGMSDGYNAHGLDTGATSTSLYANAINYYPVNNPQSAPSVTDCTADIRSINRWQPLQVPGANGAAATIQKHMTPQVANARTWALQSPGQFRAPMPPLMHTHLESEFYNQLQDVLDLHNENAMTDTTKMLAEYFADGPTTAQPPTHMMNVAILLAKSRGLSYVETSKLLFVTAQALADAGIAAWDTKLFWDAVRPITAIQCLYNNITTSTWAGPYQGVKSGMPLSQWIPYQAKTALTPPFSEYVSGYATYAGAATTAIRQYFGSDSINMFHTFPAGTSTLEPKVTTGPAFVSGVTDVANTGPASTGYSPATDLTITWTTLSGLAQDAAYSRRCGGIHFIAADVNGRALGTKVGNAVYGKYLTLLGQSSSSGSSDNSVRGNTVVQINFANLFNGVTVNGASSIKTPTV